jgi:quinate dehydrogenase
VARASHIYLVNRIKEEADDAIKSFASLYTDLRITFLQSVADAEKMETPVLIIGTVPDCPPTSEGEFVARDIALEFL